MIDDSKDIARFKLYRYFSALFCLPEKEILGDQEIWKDFVKIANSYHPSCGDQIEKLKALFQNSDERELQIEYTRLFLGTSREVPAPPYGSVYLEERRIMGKTTMEVNRFYQQEGIKIDEKWTHPPDHIASELEFMSYLVFKEMEAKEKENKEMVEQYSKKQKIFFERYLYNFGILFSKVIKKNTEHPFFIALAESFENFLNHESIHFKRKV